MIRFSVTPRGWTFLALTTLVAAAASIRESNFLVALFALLAGLAVVSAALTVLSARALSVRREPVDTFHAGAPAAVGLRIHNHSRFWPSLGLTVEDVLVPEDAGPAVETEPRHGAASPDPSTPAPPIAPRGVARAVVTLVPARRGPAVLGPVRVRVSYPPGLFACRHVLPLREKTVVRPRRVALRRHAVRALLARTEDPRAYAATGVAGDHEFSGLRDFRPGDPLRRVHWKRSAQIPGRLLVREFEAPAVREVVILLETHCPARRDARRRRRLERAIEFAGALTGLLLASGCIVRFRAFGPEPVAVPLEPRPGALDELYEALARLASSPDRPLGDLLAEEDSARGEVFFLLRIGRAPLPPWPPLRRALVLEDAEMRRLLTTAE